MYRHGILYSMRKYMYIRCSIYYDNICLSVCNVALLQKYFSVYCALFEFSFFPSTNNFLSFILFFYLRLYLLDDCLIFIVDEWERKIAFPNYSNANFNSRWGTKFLQKNFSSQPPKIGNFFHVFPYPSLVCSCYDPYPLHTLVSYHILTSHNFR